jgi:hypothetical protein
MGLAMVWLISASVGGQVSNAPVKSGTAPKAPAATEGANVSRTVDGQPDLQGVWNFGSTTPLERPKELGDKAFYTDAEVAAIKNGTMRVTGGGLGGRVVSQGCPGTGRGSGCFPSQYSDPAESTHEIVATHRTSLIIDPPDGRLPPLTPEAQARERERAKHSSWNPEIPAGKFVPASADDLSSLDRCFLGITGGPPYRRHYDAYMQIVQSRDYVVIHNEMSNHVRVIPLDGRPHLSASVRLWQGDSRGHWDGNTLVVETTNYNDLINVWDNLGIDGGGDRNLKVTERISMFKPDVLLYEYTIDDPTSYTRPWTAHLTMTRQPGVILEYGCNEGNHTVELILGAARAKDAADAAQKKGSK